MAPKGFLIEPFGEDQLLLKPVRRMNVAMLTNTNTFASSYLLKCERRSKRRKIEWLLIAFDSIGLTRAYEGRIEAKMRAYTKGSRIKEVQTLIFPLPKVEAERIRSISSGEDGFAFSFFLGDDYPCTVAGMAYGSAKNRGAGRSVLLLTDVKISAELLRKALKAAVKETFSMLLGGNGRNDCIYALSSCEAENLIVTEKDVEYDKFCRALKFVADELAKRIACAGEEKPLRYTVKGAYSKQAARAVVKTLLQREDVALLAHERLAEDVLQAVGGTPALASRERLTIDIVSPTGKLCLFTEGYALPVSVERFGEVLLGEEIEVVADLAVGNFSASGWTYVHKKI